MGRTTNLEGRLVAHNHPSNKGYTKRFQPWEILFFETFKIVQEASLKEKFYKSGKGREIIKSKLETIECSLGSYPPRRT